MSGVSERVASALGLQQAGDHRAAAELLDQALQLNPGSAGAHCALALSLWHLGRPEEALSHLGRALMIQPDSVDALLNRGIVLRELGRIELALASLDRALALEPGRIEAQLTRSAVLLELKQPEAALAGCDLALAQRPDLPEALLIRGNALMDLRRPQEALADYGRGLELRPEHPELLLNQGNALLALGRAEQAQVSYEQVLALRPHSADALYNLGLAGFRQGRPEAAVAWYDRALECSSEDAKVWVNRAAALQLLKRYDEALASVDRALKLRPGHAEAMLNRGTTLLELKRPSEALKCFEQILAADPLEADASLNRGAALHALGRHREAMESYARALALAPERSGIHSNIIFVLDFIPEISFVEHQRERHAYGQSMAAIPTGAPHGNDRDPSRPLVLGYVSGDFKHHSAAACFRPVLRRHDRARFRIACYSGARDEDDWTQEFRELADVWRPISGVDDAVLDEQIRADRVDILIDLSGHTTGNRMPLFARKPAPIQVTAWGHGGGTGLRTMDYQFTDPVFIPASARPLFAETCWDLPCCITFEAPEGAPDVGPPPAGANGFITFGSLNRLTKVAPTTLALWARILAAVPGSRLLVKDFLLDDAPLRRRILDTMAGHGLDPQRIILRGSTSHQEHMAAYNEVDIVLDTFPLNGGVTTWEALWMGAPVVATLGQSPGSRVSAAILHALGLDRWVEDQEADYFDRAVRLAADRQGLARFRAGIRSTILASAAGDPQRYTRAVEAAYRAMWHRWLAGISA
jgi:predicted O-linked N-acetylglucosamine transferase (SPINDLY family)